MKKKLLINKILRGLMFLTVAADLYMLATSNEYFFYGLFLIPIIMLVDKKVNPESYVIQNHSNDFESKTPKLQVDQEENFKGEFTDINMYPFK